VGLVSIGLAAISVQPVLATPFVLGDAADFAVLASGAGSEVKINSGPFTVDGNVGIGQYSIFDAGGTNVVVTGQVIYYGPPSASNFTDSPGSASINGLSCNTAGSCTTSGAVVQNQSVVGPADTAITNIFNNVEGLTDTSGLGANYTLSSSKTLSENGGTMSQILIALILAQGARLPSMVTTIRIPFLSSISKAHSPAADRVRSSSTASRPIRFCSICLIQQMAAVTALPI
jgi:hypothetical protein